jgi:hypothetical protein
VAGFLKKSIREELCKEKNICVAGQKHKDLRCIILNVLSNVASF